MDIAADYWRGLEEENEGNGGPGKGEKEKSKGEGRQILGLTIRQR